MSTPLLNNFDLHTHSYFSDGQLSPSELLVQANELGISHLALTDHDSTSGLAEAQKMASTLAITLINGIEFSCHWRFQLIHLLGLAVDPNNAKLIEGIEANKARRWQRAEAIHADLLKHDIDIQDRVSQMLNEDSVPTRPHFAQALVEAGYAKNKKQAFRRFLVNGKPGFVPIEWPSLDQAAGWIHAAGGIAVLAHPMRYNFTRSKLIKLINDMKACGVGAMEVATPITDAQQMTMLGQLCVEHDLLASRGSDFHSYDQPWARLGGAPALPDNVTPVWHQLM